MPHSNSNYKPSARKPHPRRRIFNYCLGIMAPVTCGLRSIRSSLKDCTLSLSGGLRSRAARSYIVIPLLTEELSKSCVRRRKFSQQKLKSKLPTKLGLGVHSIRVGAHEKYLHPPRKRVQRNIFLAAERMSPECRESVVQPQFCSVTKLLANFPHSYRAGHDREKSG